MDVTIVYMSDAEKKWSGQNKAWEKRYGTLSKETLLDEGLIRSSRDKLIKYFSEEWLKDQYSKQKKFSPNSPGGIVDLITNPMDNHGVEVVELAKYLDAVNTQDNFNTIITKLKNASDYEAIRLNLAVAYRLMNSGWENVYAEPDVGDVSGELYGKNYVVECSVITPPNPASKYAHEVFNSAYKYLKKNKYPVWLHIQFNKDFRLVPVKKVTDAVKELNHRFVKDPKEPAETLTEDFNMTEIYLDDKVKSVLQTEREKEENSLTEIGYRLTTNTPVIPGDIHSVDPNDPNQIDDGTITFGGVRKFDVDKTTTDRIKTKIKNKKTQTANLPSGTRRVFVFMAHGKVDEENWSELGATIAGSVKPSDNLDAVVFMDRRRQEFEGKLRFPSAQIHFFTKPYRLRALETSFRNMKDFEESNWVELID